MRVLNNLQILQINTERGNGMCKFCTYHFPLAIPFQWFFAAKDAKSAKGLGCGGRAERNNFVNG